MNPTEPTTTMSSTRLTDPAKQSMLLAALYIAQEQEGYLTREAIRRVARRLGLTPGQVYSTASFYSLFRTAPVGRYVIQVCDGLSCYLSDGADKVADYISAKLGIQPGETSADGRLTLEKVQCLASCGTAPAMRVNDQLYENLTPAGIDAILERLMGEV
jgi:NADH-quinone oxidoreductase E subunit